ncbi:MAG: undecaprenyldiphospho-muramoylpentapeptide beta-N-acetylglucosaminyltransferase [Clostridiales bacterium]|nr:undecaprenyldiphospho-muramoylpentapeptide beta-N-acetylglucosaminyltransferase [Clostridiales bacterium]
MRVILSGGGTGGHIYPAIAIADAIKKRHPDAEILFVGTKRGMEGELVPKRGYPIRFITVSGFNRKNLLKSFKTLRDLSKGIKEAKNILKEFKPDLVIGTGGYVCGPVLQVAGKKGLPAYIHEQNAFPGMTNKLLEKHVQKIFLSFPEGAKYFKSQDKLITVGNPIRKEFLNPEGKDYREELGIAKDDFVVLSFGGSRGATRLNEVMTAAAEKLGGEDKFRMIFITGSVHYEKIRAELKEKGILDKGRITLLPYADDIYKYFFASDLVISRSGALTVSEITACGRASILIPSPNVTGNHQFFNAKVVADPGGAVLIEEKDLTEEKLAEEILRLKNDPKLLAEMGRISKASARLDAAEKICDHLEI